MSRWGTAEHPWRELPPGLSLWNITDFLEWAETQADPRVADWPLMKSLWPTALLCSTYLILVYGGMYVMRRRAPMDLKGAMAVYNAFVTLGNTWMFYGFISEIITNDYGLVCNEVDYSSRGTRAAWLIYCYYVSKLVDFSDTFFMVLRRKFEQVSLLHVYHHAAMFFIWWFGVKFCAGGDGVVGPAFNSFVHAVMYAYYLATSLKIHIPGKKYLTQLQMTQLVCVTAHSAMCIYMDCRFPQWTHYAQIAFLLSLLYLFAAFYSQAYRGGRGEINARTHAMKPHTA